MMQEETHIFQGMRRDNHQIRQDGKFLWDAHNIRLTNREDNTLLSITNEKGTSEELITFQGYYVGHCVLGKYLVVFTANDDYSDNFIYRIEKTSNGYKTAILYHEGDVVKGNWGPNTPIEAIGIYETELVQKVYWVDGANQPRMINIVKPEYKLKGTKFELVLSLPSWDYSGSAPNPNGDRTFNWGIPKPNQFEDWNEWDHFLVDYETTYPHMYGRSSFDFVSTLELKEKVEVRKNYGEGSFAPGVIQYAFSYYEKYGRESNIFYTTPLHYISPVNRGASPEERVTNTFNIRVTNIDKRFDYLRVYSIHRTSIDAVPTVTRVTDVSINDDSAIIIDKGMSGDTIDPTQLLFIGGKSIVAGAITHKDNTLFLGNISLSEDEDWSEVVDTVKAYIVPEAWTVNVPISNRVVNSIGSTYYSNEDSLENVGSFKMGETYRCGIQLQRANGSWTDPIFLEDRVLTTAFPQSSPKSILNNSSEISLNSTLVGYLRGKGYMRVRTCVVLPSMADRTIICQGVLCPTVFSTGSRVTNSPYAQSSWFFRPATKASSIANNAIEHVYSGANIQFQHNRPLFYGGDRGAEIQSMTMPANATKFSDVSDPIKFSSSYFVDENLVTFHSPDVEFDSSLLSNSGIYEGTHLNIIGAVSLGAVIGDIDIQTSTPTISTKSNGFEHLYIGYPTESTYEPTGGLVAGLFYKDAFVKTDYNADLSNEAGGWNFLVYPWHRSGSLNNDTNRPSDKGTRSSILSKKKISNLKFFDNSKTLSSAHRYNITTPQLFNSNEVAVLKPRVGYLNQEMPYYGNVDSLVTAGNEYPLFFGNNFSGEPTAIAGDTNFKTSSEPVRIKYKSSPHLVFSLKGTDKEVQLLPRLGDVETLDGESYTPPVWSDTGGGSSSGDVISSGKFYYIMKRSRLNDFYPGTHVGTYCYCPDARLLFYGALPEPVWTDGSHVTVCWSNVTTKMDGQIIRLEGGDNFIYTPVPGVLEPTDGYVYNGATKYYKVVVSGDKCDLVPYVPSRAEVEEVASRAEASNSSFVLKQEKLSTDSSFTPYLLLGEIVRDYVTNRFGGTSDEALRSNLWLPSSEPISLDDTGDEGGVTAVYKYGDTWYSRYDCLKTYPFTQEDENSVVEIGSFMCETRVNIDGRYDRNRGQLSNLNMSPQNFNLLNEVYSQKDNFFNYRILDKNYYKQHTFANQVTWSKEKSAGEEIDPWTNITLASTLDMDGEKGKVTALRTWNEYLLCFQEKALSQILFSSRVQIPTSDGVPIEISNGYKVDGSRSLNDNIGCSNKWAITTATTGVYFLDSITDSLCLFNGQFAYLNRDKGMDWWVKQNHTDKVWCPVDYGRALNGVRAFYDNKYGDIYFTPGPVNGIDQPDALCYSEQLGQFTSLMSYGGTQAMFNFADGFYSLRGNDGTVKLYQNNVGPYNYFFGELKGWDFSFISNDNPTYTKVFDTIDLRADHYWPLDTQPLNSYPMTFIKASNEYQSAEAVVDNKNMRKKFRVWRGTIPRNSGTRQRIRNTWAMVTLGWKPNINIQFPAINNNKKAVIHDVTVHYTL